MQAQPTKPDAPCPECDEQRIFFPCIVGGRRVYIDIGAYASVPLYAYVCLGCGYTTLRPHPRDMDELRKAAEQGKTVQF